MNRTIWLLCGALVVAGCADDENPSTGGSGGSGAGGAESGGGETGGGGSDANGGAPATGGGGAATDGGGGAGGGEGGGGECDPGTFGPCHCLVDTFDGYDPESTTDYWAADGAAMAVSVPDAAVGLTPPEGTFYAGLYTDVGRPLENCFASVRVESQFNGLAIFELLEATGSGPKVILEVNTAEGTVSAVNIFDAQGNGETIGNATVTSLEAMRIQVLPTELVFEVLDDGDWMEVGTLAQTPDWIGGDVNISFGARDDLDNTWVFDDVNADAP